MGAVVRGALVRRHKFKGTRVSRGTTVAKTGGISKRRRSSLTLSDLGLNSNCGLKSSISFKLK